MAEKFIQFVRNSPESDFLQEHHPNAFLLLCLIAKRARRTIGEPDGLEIGECHIGDHKKAGLTRQQYRTALQILILRKHITFIENCRTRKKSTTGITTVGTKVKLISSTVWDINSEEGNHSINHRPTTDQPPTNHEQECKQEQEHQQQYTDVDDASCLELGKIPGMTPILKKQLSAKYSFNEIYDAVALTLQTPDIKNPIGFLKHCLANGLKPNAKVSQEIIQKIRRHLDNEGIEYSIKKNSLKFPDGIIIRLDHPKEILQKLIEDYVKTRVA